MAARIAARRVRAIIGAYRLGLRLPDGRPVGRIGFAPGAGLSGAATAVAADAADGLGLGPAVSVDLGAGLLCRRHAAGSARGGCGCGPMSVRSRRVTSSGVAKKIDE